MCVSCPQLRVQTTKLIAQPGLSPGNQFWLKLKRHQRPLLKYCQSHPQPFHIPFRVLQGIHITEIKLTLQEIKTWNAIGECDRNVKLTKVLRAVAPNGSSIMQHGGQQSQFVLQLSLLVGLLWSNTQVSRVTPPHSLHFTPVQSSRGPLEPSNFIRNSI